MDREAVLRLGILIPAVLLALASGTPPVRAQISPQHGILRGAVRSTLGDRIPYAVVSLEPGASRRFTDDSGTFNFPGLAPGAYHLRVRQVGYKPFDTTVVVTGDSTAFVAVNLEHLVVELEEIRVVARAGPLRSCPVPGPPDPATAPEAASVFEQLRQNAERYWLLADAYPAVYRMERRFGRPDHYNRTVLVDRTDTVELRTDARWHYAPGRVVTAEAGPRGGTEPQVNLPALPDFADSAFLVNHCFRLAGLQKLEGETLLRLDFRAADRINDPDANGSAYLDSSTYLIRYVRMRLTKPELVLDGLESLEATVAFREMAPSLVLPDHISSAQLVSRGFQRVETVEEQRTVDFHFLHALPTQKP